MRKKWLCHADARPGLEILGYMSAQVGDPVEENLRRQVRDLPRIRVAEPHSRSCSNYFRLTDRLIVIWPTEDWESGGGIACVGTRA
jgi:hypothetical protein